MRYSEFAGRAKIWAANSGSMAKEKGGDAIIMRSGSEYGVGMITGAMGDPKVMSVNQPTALVIKWKSSADLAAESDRLDRFTAGFQQRHPGLQIKRELIALGVEYVQWLGLDLDSDAATRRLDVPSTCLLLLACFTEKSLRCLCERLSETPVNVPKGGNKVAWFVKFLREQVGLEFVEPEDTAAERERCKQLRNSFAHGDWTECERALEQANLARAFRSVATLFNAIETAFMAKLGQCEQTTHTSQ